MNSKKDINCQHIDNFIVNELMIVAYPNKLVFGEPILKNQKFFFSKWTYFEIVPSFYSLWITILREILQIITTDVTKEKIQIFFKDEVSYSWSCEKGIVTFYLQENTIVKFALNFNIMIFNEFLVGFQHLFFKPFVLQPWVYVPFATLVREKSVDEIKAIDNLSVFKITRNVCPSKNREILHHIAEMVIRYQNILIQAKDLSVLVPEVFNLPTNLSQLPSIETQDLHLNLSDNEDIASASIISQ